MPKDIMSNTPTRIQNFINKCVTCGSCKAACPTYGINPIEPMSARGRVVLTGAILSGEVPPSQLAISRLTSCLLCGICESSCPVGVKITDVVYHSLAHLAAHDKGRNNFRRMLGFALKHPLFCFKTASIFSPAVKMIKNLMDIPFDIKLPPTPMSVGLEIFKPEKPIGRVALFTGCAVNFTRPDLGRILIRTLFNMGYEVVLPAGEVCCGAPLSSLGMQDEAREKAQRNLEVFGQLNAEAVISLCPTCTLTIKKHYSHIAGAAIENAMDAIEFLAPRLRGSSMTAPKELRDLEMGYHAPCHLHHGLGVKTAPIELLKNAGINVTVPAQANCCGFSQNMADKSIAKTLSEEAGKRYADYDAVVTACPGCMEQLSLSHPRVIHAIEALDASVGVSDIWLD